MSDLTDLNGSLHTDRRSAGENVNASANHDQRRHVLRRHPRPRPHDPAALLAAASRGDQRAWRLLVQRHNPMIRGIARGYRLSQADQDDIAQRTWLTFFRHIEQLRDPAALAGWLATTARRECLRALSASQREIPMDEPPAIDDVESTPIDEAVAQRERKAALDAALNSLPCHQRKLIRALLARPDASYEELSVALGMPHGSIGPTRQRSFERLRRNPHLVHAVAP
jgi:RNA polymerase sigma factor (sigma-70 family)